MTPATDLLPRMLAGRYRLERRLGQGGMGVVYGATDMTIRRPVAIKLILPDPGVDDEVVERFMREARNTARLQHPSIIEVFDLGRGGDGELFFVMELLEGESLSTILKRVKRMTAEETVYIATQVCSALACAHDQGVIHRDLKPANVMLIPQPDGAKPIVKVLDFGVAKAQEEGTQLTRTGALVGTIEYMAPEQILGKPVDARSDVYALGVILYRMLAGVPVFSDTAVPQIIQNHISKAPEPIRRRAPDVQIPGALERVIIRCLAKAPESRYDTMFDLEEALAVSLEDPEGADMFPSWEATHVASPANGHSLATGESTAASDESDGLTRAEGRAPKPPGIPAPIPAAGRRPDSSGWDDGAGTLVISSPAQAAKSGAGQGFSDGFGGTALQPNPWDQVGPGMPSVANPPPGAQGYPMQGAPVYGGQHPWPQQQPAHMMATQTVQRVSTISKVHALIASLVFSAAVGFLLFVGISLEGILVFGVGTLMAAVVFFLGLRRGS